MKRFAFLMLVAVTFCTPAQAVFGPYYIDSADHVAFPLLSLTSAGVHVGEPDSFKVLIWHQTADAGDASPVLVSDVTTGHTATWNDSVVTTNDTVFYFQANMDFTFLKIDVSAAPDTAYQGHYNGTVICYFDDAGVHTPFQFVFTRGLTDGAPGLPQVNVLEWMAVEPNVLDNGHVDVNVAEWISEPPNALDNGHVDVNVVEWLSGVAVAIPVNWADMAITASSGEVQADIAEIATSAAAAAALLELLDDNGTGPNIDIGDLVISANSTNASGVAITGNGTGDGVSIDGGSGSGSIGVDINSGGTNGAGMTIDGGSAQGAGLIVTGPADDAVQFTASGGGDGFQVASLGSGHGLFAFSSGGDAMKILAGTNSDALVIEGTGTGAGINIDAGATGVGIEVDAAGSGGMIVNGVAGIDITANISGTITSVTGDVSGNLVGSIGSLSAAAKTEVKAEVDAGIVTYHLDHLMHTLVADEVADGTVIAHMVSATEDWSTFNPADESFQALRTQGDAAWLSAVGFAIAGEPLTTTEVTTATALALSNIKLDHLVAVADADDPVNGSIIAEMVSATGDWSTFTLADESLEALRTQGDAAWIAAVGFAVAGEPLTTTEVTTQTALALSNIGLNHLIQDAVVGADITNNSIIAYMTSKEVTADWDDFINTTDALQAIRDNQAAGSGASYAQVVDILDSMQLNYLIKDAVPHGDSITNNSIIAYLVSKSATADWDSYTNTTDALEALRDRGDAAWVTGGAGGGSGGSTSPLYAIDASGDPMPGVWLRVFNSDMTAVIASGVETDLNGRALFSLPDAVTVKVLGFQAGFVQDTTPQTFVTATAPDSLRDTVTFTATTLNPDSAGLCQLVGIIYSPYDTPLQGGFVILKPKATILTDAGNKIIYPSEKRAVIDGTGAFSLYVERSHNLGADTSYAYSLEVWIEDEDLPGTYSKSLLLKEGDYFTVPDSAVFHIETILVQDRK